MVRIRSLLPALVVGLFPAGFAPGGEIPAEPNRLLAGQAAADITPGPDEQPGGVFVPPGKERRYEGVRQASEVRCLVVRAGKNAAALVSLDLLAVGPDLVGAVRKEAARRTGIPADNIHLCATHTHSMPTLKPLRMHGTTSPAYRDLVRRRTVDAIVRAHADAAPAHLEVGRSRAPGASFNRTAKSWKTDDRFDARADDSDRWLDTMVHVLRFRRENQADLLWYHFSAHPVVHRDDKGSGPDWPGLVNHMVHARLKAQPSFLQGHCGDVNPGDGTTFLGDPQDVTRKVFAAIEKALKSAEKVPVAEIRTRSVPFDLPLDLASVRRDLERYAEDPEKTLREKGWFRNKDFAEDWVRSMRRWDPKRTTYPITLSAVRLGTVVLVFHPGELYGGYGLTLRRASPFPTTVAVGYANDLVGYLPDPRAYEAKEYAAITVPRILDLPPFVPTAAREMTAAVMRLVRELK